VTVDVPFLLAFPDTLPLPFVQYLSCATFCGHLSNSWAVVVWGSGTCLYGHRLELHQT